MALHIRKYPDNRKRDRLSNNRENTIENFKMCKIKKISNLNIYMLIFIKIGIFKTNANPRVMN